MPASIPEMTTAELAKFNEEVLVEIDKCQASNIVLEKLRNNCQVLANCGSTNRELAASVRTQVNKLQAQGIL